MALASDTKLGPYEIQSPLDAALAAKAGMRRFRGEIYILHPVLMCATVSLHQVLPTQNEGQRCGSMFCAACADWIWEDPGGHTMSQLFSTSMLPVSDRIDAWQWNAQQ